MTPLGVRSNYKIDQFGQLIIMVVILRMKTFPSNWFWQLPFCHNQPKEEDTRETVAFAEVVGQKN